jgi:hypothetical protein
MAQAEWYAEPTQDSSALIVPRLGKKRIEELVNARTGLVGQVQETSGQRSTVCSRRHKVRPNLQPN